MKKQKNNANKVSAEPMAEQIEIVTEIRVQKADMAAKKSYDYQRLEKEDALLLSRVIEGEKETPCMKV